LKEYIDKKSGENIKYSDEALLLKWLKQSAHALKYLHAKNIMHGDIKPL
jgi:serine/threonine protein kinase